MGEGAGARRVSALFMMEGGNGLKRKTILAAEIFLAAAMVFAAAAGGWKLLDYRKGAKDYGEAAEIAQVSMEAIPEETDKFAQELAGLDLAALREINSDVVGWIAIPNTEVFYPVMQTADNNYYLKRTWKKKNSSVGAIFLDYRNAADFSGFHSIVYGHQMRDGSMFGGLYKYADAEYWQGHPTIYLVTDSGVEKYDIFAAFEVGVQDIVYRINIETQDTRQELIEFCLSHSVIETGITPEVDGNILTLSTCTGRGYATRWIVQGVRREDAA